MYTSGTLRREMQKVHQMLSEAIAANERERQDWLYGAECALSWALNQPENQTMKPSLAFAKPSERRS